MLLSCTEQESNQRSRHREGAVCRAPARQSRPSLCTHPGRLAVATQHLIVLSSRTKMFRFCPAGGALSNSRQQKKAERKVAPPLIFCYMQARYLSARRRHASEQPPQAALSESLSGSGQKQLPPRLTHALAVGLAALETLILYPQDRHRAGLGSSDYQPDWRTNCQRQPAAQRPSGYLPSSAMPRRAATTWGLSAA